MAPRVCLYYITFQCNDTCEFCQIWNDGALQGIESAPVERHIENLKNAKKGGALELQVLGGEPLLYDELPRFLAAAKEEGFETDLYTNGIKYMDRAKEIKGTTRTIYFSLDYPITDEHDRSRGTECFSTVIGNIRYALEIGENPVILYNITRDSLRFIPEMMEIAGKMLVKVRFNPVYDYNGLTGFERESLDYMKYFFNQKNVQLDLAALEFIKNRGNNIGYPRCRARETTITYLPDAARAVPCLFNRNGRQGREQACIGCASWPYMLPSFSIGLDRYRLLSEYSRLKTRQKEEIQ